MPGLYIADRNAAPGRAGLRLPYTPTTGPILLGVDHMPFLDVPMGPPWLGDFSAIAGIRTRDMSNCIVVCAVQAIGRRWGKGYFHHIRGGSWDVARDYAYEEFRDTVAAPDCHAVVFSAFVSSIGSVLGPLAAFVPSHQLSVYITRVASSDLAVAQQRGLFGETRSGGGPIGSAPRRYGDNGLPF